MNRKSSDLYLMSFTLALLSNLLLREFFRSGGAIADMSLGIQRLAHLLVLILPVTGIVLGVMIWKRREPQAWVAILTIVLNALAILRAILQFFFLSAG